LLAQVAEPLAVFASLNGAPWPGGFVEEAWHWLLQNHGHDSIGGCSREVVPLDMQYRYRQSREILLRPWHLSHPWHLWHRLRRYCQWHP
jgi:alpha-mannosidase/mannosylglycerate hydrolase